MKRQLHTLYLKHDSNFKTLSKIALSQLLLKIIYFSVTGASKTHIATEIEGVLSSKISSRDVDDALMHLIKEKKIHTKANRYFIHNEYMKILDKTQEENELLHKKVLEKYFSKAESDVGDVGIWFQETTIKFFEKFSFEWFYQVVHKKKNGSINKPNLALIIDETLLKASKLKGSDKEWLKQQYLRFVESEEPDETILFWHYGLSMFSSRLITARNYADKLSIDMFKESSFILDTNILMILDLEEHELNKSLESLEKVLEQLNIRPVYLNTTREEYIRAMEARRNDTVRVFDNYAIKVLKASKCPFIQTALARRCSTGEDVKRMFDPLLDVPGHFHEHLKIEKLDYQDLVDAVKEGEEDEALKMKINDVYKKRTGRDKRDNPKLHDAGMIGGAHYLRKKEKCWIVTNDSTLKLYAIANCLRDESEIAVGLDVILGVMAVNSGGVAVDASNFAPLFKNLIRLSLIPESDAFEVRDLAFILNTDTKVNELPEERVIEIAKEIKRRRIAGEDDEALALFLRRVIEGDKLSITREYAQAKQAEQLALRQKEDADKEKEIFIHNYRMKRIGELRNQYDRGRRINIFFMFFIPILIFFLLRLALKDLVPSTDPKIQFVVNMLIEVVAALVPLVPINKRILRKYSTYVNEIDNKVEQEVFDLLKKAKES